MNDTKSETRRLILASGSPRRRELLRRIGVTFEVVPADIDETIPPGISAVDAVRMLARRKAEAVAEQYRQHLVLGADTTVVLGSGADERILGKPVDDEDAAAMLKMLRGGTHLVHSGYALCCMDDDTFVEGVASTEVGLADIDDEAIAAYVATGEPRDKAGGYAIQGIASMFVKSIAGSYSNVVGLPLAEVVDELKRCGVWRPDLLRNE